MPPLAGGQREVWSAGCSRAMWGAHRRSPLPLASGLHVRPVEQLLLALTWEAAGRLVLKPQPAYSPELNPEERLWKWMRRVVTHNHWFETLPEEIQALRDFFGYLAGRKEQVRQLCAITTPESLFVSLAGRGNPLRAESGGSLGAGSDCSTTKAPPCPVP